MGRKLLPFSSCSTDVICDLKSATQIFENIPFQYGEGGFFFTIFVELLDVVLQGVHPMDIDGAVHF